MLYRRENAGKTLVFLDISEQGCDCIRVFGSTPF